MAFRPPPILQRPFWFWCDRPLPHIKSNVGYARLFMISSGGRGKTKFPSIIFLRGESEKKIDNQIGFQRRPRSSSAHSSAIDPFPTVSPTLGTFVCLWYHWGGATWLNFCPLMFLRGEKNYATIRIRKSLDNQFARRVHLHVVWWGLPDQDDECD